MAGAAGAAAWMLFLSNLVRNLVGGNFPSQPVAEAVSNWLKNIGSVNRQIAVLVGSFLVPIAAKVILLVSLHTPVTVDSVWSFGVMLALCYLGQQGWYKTTKYD